MVLPCYKCEAFAEFQEEEAEVCGYGVFQGFLFPGGELGQTGEFKDEGVADDIFGCLDLDALAGQFQDAVFVFGQGKTLE